MIEDDCLQQVTDEAETNGKTKIHQIENPKVSFMVRNSYFW